ncbi:Tannase/feruloyl esterase family alpha/beta hydrolase [Alteromonas sp. 38]|nr:Tannase/feruloyl esterase family alpha/beta hydrolase [Alteromonas sp. 154]VXB89784.1 Tannase/feruloyl esterase family alpha/beta hydrolase [Alteromonas sp. 38]
MERVVNRLQQIAQMLYRPINYDEKIFVNIPTLVASALLGTVIVSACAPTQSIEPQGITNDPTILTGAERCAALINTKNSRVALEITEATYVKNVDGIPPQQHKLRQLQRESFKPYCKISGYFEQRKGVNNAPYAIGFGLSLPDDWNGKFLFQGGGGLNGFIREPLGALAAGDTPAVFRGYAVATTDSGHQSKNRFDTTFFEDQLSLLNFYSGAIEKSTALALQIVEDVYQAPPDNKYFVGCSTGGREALTMAQRQPELFNGVIVGAPARQTNYSEVADLWSAKRLHQASSIPNSTPFSKAQQHAIVTEVLAQCDYKDGLIDGLIFNVEACDFKPEKLICSNNSDAKACIDASSATALNEAFAGPKYDSGRQIYPGFYFDTGISASGEKSVPGLLQAKAGPLGRQYAKEDFNLEKQLALAENFPLAGGNALLTNLSSFAHKGHKVMFFHGVSDPWFSAKDTLQYYQQMRKDSGNSELASQWSQFYFVPGMGHCRGGEKALDNFDMLTQLEHWVEHNQAPEFILATGDSMPDISRPLCPYPQIPIYDGLGDTSKATSFVCKVSKPASAK